MRWIFLLQETLIPEMWKLVFRNTETSTDNEEDLLPNRVDNDLASKLEELEQLDVLEEIQDFDQYFVICFQDLDFLPDTLNQMVMIYLQNPAKLSLFLNYDDLDDYVDLMDCDLRERYLEARTVKKSNKYNYLMQKMW